MTVGTCSYNGQGVPLNGESEIKQVTLGTDVITITGVASQTGDFLVCRNSAGAEKLSVDVNGNMTLAGNLVIKDNGTVAPTTATLSDGGFAVYSAGGTVRLAIRSGTTIYYINRTGNL